MMQLSEITSDSHVMFQCLPSYKHVGESVLCGMRNAEWGNLK